MKKFVQVFTVIAFASCFLVSQEPKKNGNSFGKAGNDISQTSGDVLNKPLAIISFEQGDNLPYLQVRVNNSKPLNFVLDSGASVWVINKSVAQALRLKADNEGKITGAGAGAVNVAYTKDVSFDLSGFKNEVSNVALIDLSDLSSTLGHQIDGIIGYDFFEQYVVEIDYDANIVRLYDPKNYQYSGSGEVIPITIKKKHAFLNAKIKVAGKESVEREYLIDSGSSDAVNDDLVAESTAPKKEVVGGVGIGQQFKIVLGRVERFQIGNYVFENTNGAAGGQKIGGELLHRFTVIFDYSRQQMILESNRHYQDGFVFDMLGAEIRAEPKAEGFSVSAVYSNSPASEAGLKEGDLITAIDGSSIESFTIDRVRRMFAQEKEYRLIIKRAGKMLKIKIKLRKLL